MDQRSLAISTVPKMPPLITQQNPTCRADIDRIFETKREAIPALPCTLASLKVPLILSDYSYSPKAVISW
jgi:hypothetical protein